MFDINPTDRELSFFWEKVIKKGEDECWDWTGYCIKSGHGQFRYRRQTVYAYRFSYMLFNPSWNQIDCVLHKCDNAKCVNPKHLFVGTRSDNMKDKVEKNRQSKGIFNAGVLTEEEALEIIRLDKNKLLPRRVIARRFGVSISQISRISNGLRWGHLSQSSGTIPAN